MDKRIITVLFGAGILGTGTRHARTSLMRSVVVAHQ